MYMLTKRDIASNNGEMYYFTGRPCKNGHVAERYTKGGACVECKKSMAGHKFRKLNGEFILFKHYAHPGDVEAIEDYIKDLLFARGIK